MRTYRLFQVDAFTREKYAGNPAGVVPDAEGLSDEDMRRVARELNNSETAFVFPSRSPDYDVHVRFFTPTREVPICGHATVAAHYVLAKRRGMAGGRVLQKTGAGILPVDIQADGDDLRIVMTQGGIEFGREIQGEEQARLLAGLHLRESDLRAGYPVQIVSTGHSKVMVPIVSRSLLDALTPDSGALAALSRDIGCNGYYVFCADWSDEARPVHGRMFAPAAGIPEDPVTGNANGPLGAYLTFYGKLPPREEGFAFTIKQGEAIGRKGYMQVIVRSFGGDPVIVKIGGRARIVFKTEIGL